MNVVVTQQAKQVVTVSQEAKRVVNPYIPGPVGKSAYQSYLDTTTDDPVLTEAEWSSFEGAVIGNTAKSSAVDEGFFGQMSLTDDYFFICVQGGTAGNAIWKKAPLFKSN